MQKWILTFVFSTLLGWALAAQTFLPFSISLFSQAEIDSFAINTLDM